MWWTPLLSGVDNDLHLITTKTKELVVDFHRRKSAPSPVSMDSVTVSDYKYLGVHIDQEMDWAKNTEAVTRRARKASIS